MATKVVPNDFLGALEQLHSERGLSSDEIIETIETALLHAYRREFGPQPNIRVKVDPKTGHLYLYETRRVTLLNTGQPDTIPLAAARLLKPEAREGEKIERSIELPPAFGRIAAQTCKQVVLQKMREVERDHIFDEFSNQENELVSGIIQRIEQRHVFISLGKVEAVMPPTEQVAAEQYRPGQRLRFYLVEVHRLAKGPQLIVSRTHRGLLKRLLEMEVPEIHEGRVDIRAIAREPGARSKVAVWSRQEGLDPIGACVGLHRTRIQNVVNELQGEKVDIVTWDSDPAVFVANALSPARVLDVRADDVTRRATVIVAVDQMSLAIGKEGQNARLTAKLTGWKIDIRTDDRSFVETPEHTRQTAAATNLFMRDHS